MRTGPGPTETVSIWRTMPVSISSTDMMMYGIHAMVTLQTVSGLSLEGSCAAGSRSAAPAAWPSFGAVVAGGAEGVGAGGMGNCHSVFGFQNLRKIAVTIMEKMPPPMSVIGH